MNSPEGWMAGPASSQWTCPTRTTIAGGEERNENACKARHGQIQNFQAPGAGV